MFEDKFIVGLTGGIASGKTKASDYFASLGIDIVDADIAARTVVAPGSHCLAKIEQRFGSDILLEDGNLNRARLRDIIFSDEQQKHWLNQLMHPAIRQQIIDDLTRSKSPYTVLVAPLLIENNLTTMVNRVLVIDVPEEVQIRRTMSRDSVVRQQAEAILASQTSRQSRLDAADDVISNDKGVAELENQLTKLHNTYLSLANK